MDPQAARVVLLVGAAILHSARLRARHFELASALVLLAGWNLAVWWSRSVGGRVAIELRTADVVVTFGCVAVLALCLRSSSPPHASVP